MKYSFQLCNTLCKYIISTSILFTTLIYGQKVFARNTDSSTLADSKAVPHAASDPCIIPENTDIFHFPIEYWDSFSEFVKTAEEIVNTVDKSLNSFMQFFERQPDNSDHNTQQSTKNTLPYTLEKAAYLQFTLAKLIQQNPNSLVFHEFTTQIYDTRHLNKLIPWTTKTISHPSQLPDLEDRKPAHLYYLVREQFPHGLPIQYKYLDESQKHTLAIAGGVHTLFFMDQLPIIFPSISNGDYHRLSTNEAGGFSNHCNSYYDGLFKVCVSSYRMLQVFRAEKLAAIVNNLLNITASSQQEKPIAILAYRDTHDLSRYFPNKNFYKLPSDCIQPNAE